MESQSTKQGRLNTYSEKNGKRNEAIFIKMYNILNEFYLSVQGWIAISYLFIDITQII